MRFGLQQREPLRRRRRLRLADLRQRHLPAAFLLARVQHREPLRRERGLLVQQVHRRRRMSVAPAPPRSGGL